MFAGAAETKKLAKQEAARQMLQVIERSGVQLPEQPSERRDAAKGQGF